MSKPLHTVVEKVQSTVHNLTSKSSNTDNSNPTESSQAQSNTMSSDSLPKTYKAVVVEKAGAPFELRDVPMEMPKEGEILIKVHACGVCHSDSALQQGHFGPMAKFPITPGHEVIGTVVAVGSGVKNFKKGDRAGGPWHGAHDGICKTCQKGLFQMCDNELVNGVSRNGGYGEYCILRSEAGVHIPPEADTASYAPLLCAGVTVFNSMRRMNIEAGGTVAIQGLGGLGHLALQYARKMGFRTVAISTSDAKRDFAKKLGATDYIDTSKQDATAELQKMGGANLVMVTAPNPKVMSPLVDACAPLGRVVILAPVGEIPVNTVSMIMKGISVWGWPSGHAIDSEDAINFAEHQGVECLVEKFPLEKVQDAVDHMMSGKARFRCVLTMD